MGAPSQFTIYSSGDVGAPVLNGLTGSMVTLLDACLVNGYGSKPAAGWLKPIPNLVSGSGLVGVWQQPSGSGFNLFINDANTQTLPSGQTTKECWATGYENILGLTGSNWMGTGFGQFPLPGQQLITTGTIPNMNVSGGLYWRKSNTADAVARPWIMFADARTMYLFVRTSDITTPNNVYYTYWFGDIFSFKPTNDFYKCMINGRNQSFIGTFQASAALVDTSDMIGNMLDSTALPNAYAYWMARTAGGGGNSIPIRRVGDWSKTITTVSYEIPNNAGNNSAATPGLITPMGGTVPTPNTSDNSLYMSPISVAEVNSPILRGRMRGMYMLSHSSSCFTDGQVIAGGNEYAGKTFQIVLQGAMGGFWVIETSPTVETNDL